MSDTVTSREDACPHQWPHADCPYCARTRRADDSALAKVRALARWRLQLLQHIQRELVCVGYLHANTRAALDGHVARTPEAWEEPT